MNKNLLRGVMIQNGDTQEKLAKALGVSLSRLNAALNGAQPGLREEEIREIVRRYQLTPEAAYNIFFAQEVH